MIRRDKKRRHTRGLQHLLMGLWLVNASVTYAAPIGGTLINPLNFGRMIVSGVGGDLAMNVSTGTVTGSGGVAPFPGGSPTRLRIDLTGDAGTFVSIAMPPAVNLTGAVHGGVISWFPILNTPLTFTMPGSSTFTLYMAGSLAVPYGSLADAYSGSVTVAIDYTF
jgi:hypothetical protein